MRDLNVGLADCSVDVNKSLQVTTEGVAATYGVAGVLMTPAATPTDVAIITGSATKTIRVKQVIVSGVATTAGTMDVSLVKHTVANTAGTATTPTIAKFDSGDAAASAVVSQYSVNPTIDASKIIVANKMVNMGVAGAAGVAVFDFSTRNDKAIVLRGIAQQLAINLNGQAVPTGGAVSYSIEWEEDLS